jgi:AcrR family transcriptional regulator
MLNAAPKPQIVDFGGERELSATVVKILEGAVRAIGSIGPRRFSMSDVVEVSGVSRGTLYRYFSSKEELLAAVTEFVCSNFVNGIREVARDIEDPIERFRVVMRFFSDFTEQRAPRQVWQFEPSFHVEFFQSHFEEHKAAVKDALATVMDYFEFKTQSTLNREAIVEALVRMQLSTLIVPASPAWANLWDSTPDALQAWIMSFTTQTNFARGRT